MEDGSDIVGEGKGTPADSDVDLDDGEEVDFDMEAPGKAMWITQGHKAKIDRRR